MSSGGIIANPASGRDIRRLVAHASVFNNNEKVNILQRTLLALDAIGVDRVSIMPDCYGLGLRAREGLKLGSLQVVVMEMPVTDTERDSAEAAARLSGIGVGCIVVLGGDGTNRAVAKGCGDTPVVPISTGTNNVFPTMVEGTVAGVAAGMVATGAVDPEQVTFRSKRLEVCRDGELVDIALVDVVTVSDLWVASRAIWDPARIREVVLARAEPCNIGISSVGGCLRTLGDRDDYGMYMALGPGGMQVLAPVAPGLVTRVSVRDYRVLPMDQEVTLDSSAATIALDGEREIEIYDRPSITVRLTRSGPRVVDISRCMDVAARSGVLRRSGLPSWRE